MGIVDGIEMLYSFGRMSVIRRIKESLGWKGKVALGWTVGVGLVVLGVWAFVAYGEVSEWETHVTIENNLRQIARAAEEHFGKTGADVATKEDLVPSRFARLPTPVAGENYELLFPIRDGFTELIVTEGDGTVHRWFDF